jgi:hypothetical protein
MRLATLASLAGLAVCARGAAAPPSPTAGESFAKTLAPEVVGNVAPVAPKAGDYAMSLALRFSTFRSMEMRIDDSRTGAMLLSLRGDGTAQTCLGEHSHHVVDGQYHYKPAGQREHRSSEDARILGMLGTWKVADGVASITLDRVVWNTCDLAKAIVLNRPMLELRCIATATTDRLPAGSLVCAAPATSELLSLGMPMTTSSRTRVDTPMRSTPNGHELVLAAPGIAVDVAQDAQAALPTFAFKPGAISFVNADFQLPKP